MSDMSLATLLVLPLLLQIIGLTFVVLIDSYLSRFQRRVMLIIIVMVVSLIAQNLVGYYLDVQVTRPFARTIVAIFGYTVRPMILVMFLYLSDREHSHLRAWILIAVNTLIHLTALFSGICFSIGPDNVFRRGPMGYSCHIVSGILIIYLLCLSIREYSRHRRSEAAIPVFNALLIIASVAADSFVDYRLFPVSFLTIAVVSGCVFHYIWIHLQLVRAHENSLMADQRMRIMISQIQPHFMFNTLSTIQALCLIDPQIASETVEKFGTYLRQNIDSLNREELIPFKDELSHTQIYVDIEKTRFPSIKVEYNIEDGDFSLPALSVQPLVENAIRHGVRIRENGLITVRTWRDLNAHVITITDNGCGFDPEKALRLDETHIGLRNVKERIEKQCGGRLLINRSGSYVPPCKRDLYRDRGAFPDMAVDQQAPAALLFDTLLHVAQTDVRFVEPESLLRVETAAVVRDRDDMGVQIAPRADRDQAVLPDPHAVPDGVLDQGLHAQRRKTEIAVLDVVFHYNGRKPCLFDIHVDLRVPELVFEGDEILVP